MSQNFARIVVSFFVFVLLLVLPSTSYSRELSCSLKLYGSRGYVPPSWKVMVTFDSAVRLGDLRNKIKLLVDGKEKPFSILSTVSSNQDDRDSSTATREFMIEPLSAMTGSENCKLIVQAGLSDINRKTKLTRDVSLEFTVQKTASVTEIKPFFENTAKKGVELILSTPADIETLQKAITISPEVPGWRLQLRNSRYFLEGNFKTGMEYELKIEGTPSKDGRTFLVPASFNFIGPGKEPSISFRSSVSLIELKSRQLVPVTVTNISKIEADLIKLPLPFLISRLIESKKNRGSDPVTLICDSLELSLEPAKALEKLNETSEKLSENFKKEPFNSFRSDRSSWSRQLFFTEERPDKTYTLALPLTFRDNPAEGGVYLLSLSSKENDIHAPLLACITDMAITYKFSHQSILVWVTSLNSAKPVSGAKILAGASDGTIYALGETDKDGLLMTRQGNPCSSIKMDGTPPVPSFLPSPENFIFVIATCGNDISFIDLEALRLRSRETKPKSFNEASLSKYSGYAFTERGIYRPGDTVHFKLFAREFVEKRVISSPGMTAEVSIIGPKGDRYFSVPVKFNEFGTACGTFEVKTFYPLGHYELKLNRGETTLYTHTFMVQEFKPPRHMVSVDAREKKRISNDYIGLSVEERYLEVEISGKYYAGGPAKFARVRWKADLVPGEYRPSGFEGYQFGSTDVTEQFLESGEGILDREGRLIIEVPVDTRMLNGQHSIKVSATVVDIDGSPATGVKIFSPVPDYSVGILSHPARISRGDSIDFTVIVVGHDGKPVNDGEILAEIFEEDWFYVQKRDSEGNLVRNWESGYMRKMSQKADIKDGRAVSNISFGTEGEYRIEFSYEKDGRRYSARTRVTVGWDYYDSDEDDENPLTERMRDTEMLLAIPAKRFKTGETVEINFQTPRYVEMALVTTELDDIISASVIHVGGTKGSWSFRVDEHHRPNVYVSVLAVAPREGFPVYSSQVDTGLPQTYFGYSTLEIDEEIEQLKLEIAPGITELSALPGTEQTLEILVTDRENRGVRAELAVVAVDEGILALTNFRIPDLSSLVRFLIPLSVFSGELRYSLLDQALYRMFDVKEITGGGAGTGVTVESLRKNFRPVALVELALVTDENGRATVSFKLPDNTTVYRVYAIACTAGKAFAKAERKMSVSKPFFIEPMLPRFLITGDSFKFPVLISNRTGVGGNAGLETILADNISFELPEPVYRLEPFSTLTVTASAKAGSASKDAILALCGSLNSDSDAVRVSIPVLSRYPSVKRFVTGHFRKSTTIKYDFPEELSELSPEELAPEHFKARLLISTTDWPKLAPGLRYLLSYPYGCVEQTSSGILPLAALRHLISQGFLPSISLIEVDRFIDSGIKHLLKMQVSSGGFGYWPGATQATYWATLYATFALTMAKEAGAYVPSESLEKALSFIKENLFGEHHERNYHRYGIDELAALNLALNHSLSKSDFDVIYKNYDSPGIEGKAYILFSASILGALPEKELKEQFIALKPVRKSSPATWHSSVYREAAACLLAGTVIDPHSPENDLNAGFLLNSLKQDGRWSSTADTGIALFALARYFEAEGISRTGSSTVEVTVKNNKPHKLEVTWNGSYMELDGYNFWKNPELHLNSDDNKLLSFILEVEYPGGMEKDIEKGFRLDRRYENTNGRSEILKGDIVKVILEIEAPVRKERGELEYVVLEDPLPAGLVAINSSLATEGAFATGNEENGPGWDYWVDGAYEMIPDYLELRDDRVLAFRNYMWDGKYRFSYYARAVAEGTFWCRPARISLMYDADVYGIAPGTILKILPATAAGSEENK